MTFYPLSFPLNLAKRAAETRSRFVVTGAGGWFGRATLEMLEEALGPDFESSVFAFASASRPYRLRSGRRITLFPLESLDELNSSGSQIYLAHYAFLTRDKLASVGADAFVSTNRRLTSFVRAQAIRLKATGVFSTSSGAVYKRDGALEDSLQANPYGQLKLEEEAAFARLRDAGTRVALCRVFNVAGPFINRGYALSSLIEDALFGERLLIQARHEVYRSYAHVKDIIATGFAGMLGCITPPDAPYDTAGDEIVEVGELADRIRSILDCSSKPIVRGAITTTLEDRYVGDKGAFIRLAGDAGIVCAPLDEQIRDTASFLAQIGQERPGT